VARDPQRERSERRIVGRVVERQRVAIGEREEDGGILVVRANDAEPEPTDASVSARLRKNASVESVMNAALSRLDRR